MYPGYDVNVFTFWMYDGHLTPLLHLFASFLDPHEFPGHTSAIKKALWCNDDKQILSAADDKTVRSVAGCV